MKHMLIISPTPTHPQDAGNRARIFRFVEKIKQHDIEIKFLYTNMEGSPSEEMIAYWGNNLITVDTQISQFISLKKKVKKILFYLLKSINFDLEALIYNFRLDDWYDNKISKKCIELQSQFFFDYVVSQYIFMSKALTTFGNDTVKIIDTHDCFSNRYKIFPKVNGKRTSSWFSVSKKDEITGLNRANKIIAIQESEAEYFRTIIKKQVLTIGYLDELDFQEINQETSPSILLFASSNPINIDGYQYFLDNIFPLVKEKVSKCKFLVAGKLCDEVEKVPDIEYLGRIENKKSVYRQAKIAINPMRYGSGLKIKTLEALSYGVPIVSTENGALGLKWMENRCIFVFDDPQAMAEAIIELLTDKHKYFESCNSIVECLVDYERQNEEAYAMLLNNEVKIKKLL